MEMLHSVREGHHFYELGPPMAALTMLIYFDNISTYIKIYQYWAYPEFHEKTGFENEFLHE